MIKGDTQLKTKNYCSQVDVEEKRLQSLRMQLQNYFPLKTFREKEWRSTNGQREKSKMNREMKTQERKSTKKAGEEERMRSLAC